MSRAARRILLLAGFAVVAYFLVPVLMLRFALDRLLFPLVDSGLTHEDRVIDVPLPAGQSIRIRQYGGSGLPHCAIFFPGSHGGISTYEQTLFPSIEKLGIAVYALSYPGQDAAKGRSHRATLIQDVDTALSTVKQETSCQPANSVFIGRSMGAALALHAAQRIRPKGLLLDGFAPTLTSAVNAAMRDHLATRPWTLLPIRSLVQDDSPLLPIIHSLRPIPIVIFQGKDDQVTPLAEAQNAVLSQDNVQFFAVPGATHTDAYLRSMSQYLQQLAELAGQ